MIRIKIFLFTSIFIMFLASSTLAFYEYVDEFGVTRYTDDINEVPPDQRYEKEEVDIDDEAAPETENKTDDPALTPANKKEIDYDASLEDLKERMDVLVKERKAIEREDDELIKEKVKLKPGDDIEEYNEQAAKLKQRTRELDEKREEFNKKVDALNAEIEAYNATVAKKLEAQLQEYESIKSKNKKSPQEE